MRTGMKILVALALVAGIAGVSQAATVDMTITPGAGPGGEDVCNFVMTLAPADGDFLNAEIVVTMDAATIQDPVPMTTAGGTAMGNDTWVSTPYDQLYGTGTSVIYDAYNPMPPVFDTPPQTVMDWDFYDTYSGDDHTLGSITIARVLVSPGATGTAQMTVWSIGNMGGEVSNHVIPEPATLVLLGLGAVAMLRRKR